MSDDSSVHFKHKLTTRSLLASLRIVCSPTVRASLVLFCKVFPVNEHVKALENYASCAKSCGIISFPRVPRSLRSDSPARDLGTKIIVVCRAHSRFRNTLMTCLRHFVFAVSVDDIQPEREQVHSNVGEKKRTAGRTRFSIYQRAELEAAFTASPYLSTQTRLALAARLRVTPVAVQVT